MALLTQPAPFPPACRAGHNDAGFRGVPAAAAAAEGPAGAAAQLAAAGEADRVYRLASVGQDCQLALWDVVVSEEALAAAQQASAK